MQLSFPLLGFARLPKGCQTHSGRPGSPNPSVFQSSAMSSSQKLAAEMAYLHKPKPIPESAKIP